MECVETLEITAQKNSPVYRDLHVDKDVTGTRETLPSTARKQSRKEQTYKRKSEMGRCRKGVGGGRSYALHPKGDMKESGLRENCTIRLIERTEEGESRPPSTLHR